MKMYAKGFRPLVFALFIALILGGALAQADNRPRLRIVHAAPGLSNVDIYLGDILFFRNIFYRYISDYVPMNPGDQTLRVRPAGTSPRDASLVEVTAPYGENRDYTLIASGRIGDIQHWRLEDDNNLPGEGTARVKIVHASYDAPTTEFCLAHVCRTLAFREDSEYLLLDPGTYIPKVRLNGTDATYINIPPLVLNGNSVYSIFMTGLVQGQPGLQLLYTFDAGEASTPYPLPPDAPLPPDSAPPPAYPPVTGAFLAPKLLGIIGGALLIVVGGLGFWVTRRRYG